MIDLEVQFKFRDLKQFFQEDVWMDHIQDSEKKYQINQQERRRITSLRPKLLLFFMGTNQSIHQLSLCRYL